MKNVVLIIFFTLSWSVYANDKRIPADKITECAALYGWAYKHANDEKRKEEYKEWLTVYRRYAVALSSEDYFFEKFKLYVHAVDFRIRDNIKEAEQFLFVESRRCGSFDNLGDDVVKAINELQEKKIDDK